MNDVKKLDPGTTHCLRFVGRNLSEDHKFFKPFGLSTTQVTSIKRKIKRSYPEFNRSLSLH